MAQEQSTTAKYRGPGWSRLRVVPVLAMALAPILARAAEGHSLASELAYANQALRAWLELAEAEELYLLADRKAGQVRLMHGRAVLRLCRVRLDSLGARPAVRVALEARLRRYRPSDPWAVVRAGPFDWEQNLAEEATDDSALYFSGGLLVYASAAWGRPRAPALALEAGDLRALFNASAPGMELVVLPAGWDEESADAGP